MRNQPSTRKQEHEVKPVCYVLWPWQIIIQRYSFFLNGVDNRKRHLCALIR